MIYGPDTTLQGEIMMPFSEATSFYSDCCLGYSKDRKFRRKRKIGNHQEWICTKNKSSYGYKCIFLDI